jgi:hypothetical protein
LLLISITNLVSKCHKEHVVPSTLPLFKPFQAPGLESISEAVVRREMQKMGNFKKEENSKSSQSGNEQKYQNQWVKEEY